ncbi:MAG TPA: hypothetical protein VNK73_07250 [Actinomycetota bacterium]|nr:hypothetical protein [Actinomycetota bacterium]
MRFPPSRVLLPFVAVVALLAVVGTVAVARDRGQRDAAGPGAGAASAANRAGGPGARQPAAAFGDPAVSLSTAGLPRVTQAAATTDAVVIWNGRGAVPAASARAERPKPGTRAQVRLDLAITAATGRARAVVRVRNLTSARLALTGTLQLLVTGPGAATVVRQRLNRPLARGATAAVSLPLQPASPGVYRVRASFVPA